jgi:glutamine synthetase
VVTHDVPEVASVSARPSPVSTGLSLEGLSAVHLGLVDASGTLREKRLGPAAAARAFEHGWSFIDAVQWWDPHDRTWRDGGAVEAEATVDHGSGRRYPFEPEAALFLADFTGELGELSPRVQLQRMVDRAAACGLVAEVGWELELIVLDQSGAEVGDPTRSPPVLRPAMFDNRCWSALTPAVEAEAIAGLVAALAAGDVPVDHVCAELGPGCLELALEHGPAVRAADDATVAKLFTKAYYARRGQTATFMAQLGQEFPGLGGHPSLSFLSTTDGRPVVVDELGELSPMARSAVAGVVTLLPELLVMAAPNPNSYRRFAPGNWAPSSATWGPGNYSCALRTVTGTPAADRLELRIAGADTSPHLCSAMFLGAAVWGVERGLVPPAPVVPPADGRSAPGTGILPRNLLEASERFATSTAARELFGPSFVDHYAASRMAEEEACRRFVPVEEVRRYLQQV